MGHPFGALSPHHPGCGLGGWDEAEFEALAELDGLAGPDAVTPDHVLILIQPIEGERADYRFLTLKADQTLGRWGRLGGDASALREDVRQSSALYQACRAPGFTR
jgi:hypothetical protein